MSTNTPEILHLIGDPNENFYILGKKDRAAFLYLEKLLKPPKNRPIGTGIDGFYQSIIESYAEGIGLSTSQVLSVLTQLELSGNTNSLPEINPLTPRTKTFLNWNSTSQTVDINSQMISPLLGHGLFKPTLLLFDFPNLKKVIMPSWEGMSLFFCTALNLHGLHLTLHHQYGDIFEDSAHLISPTLFNLAFSSNEFSALKKQFKNFHSERSWGITAVMPEGSVLHIDQTGAQNYTEKFQLSECHQMLFDEAPLKNQPRALFEPALLKSYQIQDHKNIAQFESFSSGLYSHFLSVNLHHFEIKTLNKTLSQDTLYLFKDPFNQPKKISEIKVKSDTDEALAYEHLHLAQYYFSQKSWEDAFHHIQMSLSLHHRYDVELMLHFWEFLKVKNKKEWAYIYQDVLKIQDKISEPMQDLGHLLTMLIELKLKLKRTIELTSFKHELFLEIYSKIEASSSAIQDQFIDALNPRLDLMDLSVPTFLYK